MNNKLSMRKAAWLGSLLVAGICCAGAYAGAADVTTTATYCPPEDNSFLINPGKGWAVYHDFDNADTAAMARASVCYTRYMWADIHTNDHAFNWAVIDDDLDKAIFYGKKFAFGVMSWCNPKGVPQWAMDAGCKHWGCEPRWADPIYLSKQAEFTAALRERYDGNPHIAYIDIRSYGKWGEWHSGTVDPGDEVKKQLVDQWAGFKKTPIILPISGDCKNTRKVGVYARDRYGFGFREDSSQEGVRWTTCAACFNVAPAVAEWVNSYQTQRSWWSWESVEGSIHGSMYSYQNLAQWNNEDANLFVADHAALLDKWQNVMGYWFKVARIDYPAELGNGATRSLSFAVRNDGVAPIYVNWSQTNAPRTYVRLALLDSTYQVLARSEPLDGINPFDWKPGKTVTNRASFSFPKTAAAKQMAIGVFSDPSARDPDIWFANAGRLWNGWMPFDTNGPAVDPAPKPLNLGRIPRPGENLATNRTYRTNGIVNDDRKADRLFDGNPNTEWCVKAPFEGTWAEVDFGERVTFNKVILGPDYENRVTRYRIDYCDDGRHWRVAYRGETIGKVPVTLSFPQVTATKARLLVMSATGWPAVFEMGIYYENTAAETKGEK